MLVWRDGTKMLIDDGIVDKPPAQVLASPDLKDQFATPYNVGPQSAAPGEAVDPGRVRVDAFFRKIYGDCRKGGVAGSLVAVPWLPRHGGGTVRATSINGVAARLKEVSDELDSLPDQFISYLVPTAGVFSCRVIAGTERTSMHAYGAAIDLNATHANYWRTANTDGAGHLVYQNAIPNEIVDIFERHGFIWGGKWYHYDTMHFEYRPELLAKQTQ